MDLVDGATPLRGHSQLQLQRRSRELRSRGPNGDAIILYRNNGDGTFTDVSKESGILGQQGSFGLTAVVIDADEDGWPDIFVACDSTFSYLLMNNKDGSFREEALLRGVAVNTDGQRMAGMGVGVGDYDLDGHLDIVKTHFADDPPSLYHNHGKGNFEDTTFQAGLGVHTQHLGWGAASSISTTTASPTFFWATGTSIPRWRRCCPSGISAARSCTVTC